MQKSNPPVADNECQNIYCVLQGKAVPEEKIHRIFYSAGDEWQGSFFAFKALDWLCFLLKLVLHFADQ